MEISAMLENVNKSSVPPGFVSLTSFTVKRPRQNEGPHSSIHNRIRDHPDSAPTYTTSYTLEIEKYKKSRRHRPWIFHNQLDHDADESESELFDTLRDLHPKTSLPKGVFRGFSNCGYCVKVTARWQPAAASIPVLEKAPVFYPTEDEFKDTLKYIASIRPQAEGYGICRIVPPASWEPPCLLKGKERWHSERFTTRIQPVNELQYLYSKRKLHRIAEMMNRKQRRTLGTGTEHGSGDGFSTDLDEVICNEEDFEFECGPGFTLESFKKYADDFKEQYFCKKDNVLNADVNTTVSQKQQTPSVENIEGEYRRIVENPTEEIEVLYCADLDMRTFCSGFPLLSSPLELQDYPKYVESGWNMNNTANLPGSLLAFESCDTSIVSSPRICVGMCFSSRCWNVERHHLYSVYYMHFGAPKIWYGIPGEYFYKFEAALKRKFPDLLKYPELLHKLVTQLSPSSLESEGVPVYRCVQYPREFVLVFPGAYNSVTDCGFNCSEAVNFAPFDWLPHGQNAIELYREQCRRTSISHDKLLLRAAIDAMNALSKLTKMTNKTRPWIDACGEYQILLKVLKSRIRQESSSREYLGNPSRSQEMEKDFDSSTKRECAICFYDLHLSAVGCPCSPDRYTCLQHSQQLCSCGWSERIFLFRNKISELNELVGALEGKLSAIRECATENLEVSNHKSVKGNATSTAATHGKTSTSTKELKTLPSRVSSKTSTGKCASEPKTTGVVPRILLKGKERSYAPISKSQPSSNEEVTFSKQPPDASTEQIIVNNPQSSLAENSPKNLSANKQVTGNCSSSSKIDLIVLSDDDE